MDPSPTAFEQGFQANSAYENPFWLNYPNKAPDSEVIQARQWVDGYVTKITMKEPETASAQKNSPA